MLKKREITFLVLLLLLLVGCGGGRKNFKTLSKNDLEYDNNILPTKRVDIKIGSTDVESASMGMLWLAYYIAGPAKMVSNIMRENLAKDILETELKDVGFNVTDSGKYTLESIFSTDKSSDLVFNSTFILKETESMDVIYDRTFRGMPTSNVDSNTEKLKSALVYCVRQFAHDIRMHAALGVAAEQPQVAAQTKTPVQRTPAGVVKKQLQAQNEEPFPKIDNHDGVAVVIGNKDYTDSFIPSVDFAENDASAVRDMLINELGYRQGNIIYEKNISKSGMARIFGIPGNYKGRLYNYLKRGRSDIFVYYSGHGAPGDGQNKSGYFVPSDASAEAIEFTAYPSQLVYDNIAKIANEMKSPNVYIVVDACFSGQSENGSLLKNVSPALVIVKEPVLKIQNAVIMMSAAPQQMSSWYEEKRHSMFTYFFLSSISDLIRKNTPNATVGDVFGLIADESEGVPYQARRTNNRIQTPQLLGDPSRTLIGSGRIL